MQDQIIATRQSLRSAWKSLTTWAAGYDIMDIRLCNPSLDNGSVNTFPRTGPCYATHGICFPWGLCRALIREVNSEATSSWKYKDESEAWVLKISWVQIRRGVHSDWRRNNEKISQWFEALVYVLTSIARRRLVETENPSACAAVNCKFCKSAIAL
jgi:hypothetical protein